MAGREVGADRHEGAGERDHRKRQRHGEREDVAVVDAHQAPPSRGRRRSRGRRCPAGCGRARAARAAITPTADRNTMSGNQPMAICSPHGDARGLERAGLEPLRVGGEHLQQHVLDDDREAEGHQQRRQDVPAQRQVEDAALQRVADPRHHRHDDDQADERMHAGAVEHGETEEGGEHDQVAVRDVDQPHHAEDQREPGREQRVEPAQQHALDDGVEPLHRGSGRSCGGAGHGRQVTDGKYAAQFCRTGTAPRIASGESTAPHTQFVMAGLVPAIHGPAPPPVSAVAAEYCATAWMPGTSPGMTVGGIDRLNAMTGTGSACTSRFHRS